MGSFFSSSSVEEASSSEPEVESDETPLLELPIIDLSEQNIVRQTLDQGVIDALQNIGYEPNRDMMKSKLLIMFCASTIAGVGYATGKVLPPAPYPGDRFWAAVCVFLYFALSTALTYLTMMEEEDLIWTSLPNEETNTIVRFKSNMERSDTSYKVTLEFKDKAGAKDVREPVTSTWYIGDYFDKEGRLNYDRAGGVCDSIEKIHSGKKKKT
jgi:hypothetical protein